MERYRWYTTGAGRRHIQADFSDPARGIPRTKRSFASKADAEAWVKRLKADTDRRLTGHRRRRLFGEALTHYLAGASTEKRTHQDDLDNARVLRWPFRWDGRWWRLEELPIEPGEGEELWIVPGLAAWTEDLKRVQARAYLDHQIYHRREDGRWYLQPDPAEGERPAPRRLVTDQPTVAALEACDGRGPFSGATLRVRQALVKRVLTLAWRRWDWSEQPYAARVELEPKATPRDTFLSYEQLRALLIALPVGLDDFALALAWVGWRLDNVRSLTWDRVVFPATTPEGEVLQHGVILAPRGETKNADPLVQPMSRRLEALLRARWDLRSGRVVFHDGSGGTWGDFRKAWKTACRKAGLPATLRRHDLRHTWASHMIQAGATDRELQELGGWRDPKMLRVYAHLRTEHLLEAVNRPTARKPT